MTAKLGEHRRSFAGGLTVTDPGHQSQLERQRARRRQRHEVKVEIRPLARYDQLIPAGPGAASELAHLFRALKAPAAARALPALAERAREEQWSYERFAEALLSTGVSSRDSHGDDGRSKAARFPARKTLEEPHYGPPMRRHSRTSPLVTYRPDPRAGRPVVICDTDREEHGATCAERYAYQALAVASALVRADVEDELTRRQNAPRRR